jgi:malonate decarboxylase alpha subunit
MEWNVQKMKKQERLQRASHMMRGKIIQAENIVPVLESVVYPNDRVVLEGDNQKQATFLSQALASVDPAIVHGLTMLIPAVSREEHLDLFEKGIAHELNFAFAGMQSVRLAKMLEDNQLKIGSIHTYLELYARLLVDLIPNVCLVAAEMADEDGNLFTGYSTEDTPILVEATAFKDGIVIVQVNDIVGKGALPRVDIPGDWVDIVVRSDEPYQMEALFTRDPAKIRDSHILMAMMTIKGIYANTIIDNNSLPFE